MRPFQFSRAENAKSAVMAYSAGNDGSAPNSTSQYLAGGTTLLDLMMLDVMRLRFQASAMMSFECFLNCGGFANISDFLPHQTRVGSMPYRSGWPWLAVNCWSKSPRATVKR